MSMSDPTGTDWTDQEIDLIVADYFEMLRKELAGELFVKSHRNAALQELSGRSKGSIEYKHQNISAVMMKLGLPRIEGYKPAWRYQGALVDGIERYLAVNKPMLGFLGERIVLSGQLSDATGIYFGPPPDIWGPSEEMPDSDNLRRLVRNHNPAERDARNRILGKQGEELVLRHEENRLRKAGRTDLARKVRWVADIDGDGAGYDILSFDESGIERLLEVKTTVGHQRTPFFLSENERAVSEERRDSFRLVRLYDFLREPRAFELLPPLENSVVLDPAVYRASFQ